MSKTSEGQMAVLKIKAAIFIDSARRADSLFIYDSSGFGIGGSMYPKLLLSVCEGSPPYCGGRA